MKPPTQTRSPDGGPAADQPRTRGDASRPEGPSLPHDRDQQAASTDAKPNAHIDRAARDLQQGQVDTDLRATPGLDADRRGDLVEGGEHGAAGKPPASRRRAARTSPASAPPGCAPGSWPGRARHRRD